MKGALLEKYYRPSYNIEIAMNKIKKPKGILLQITKVSMEHS